MAANDPITQHATAVAHSGNAALFIGASGSGKSSLALQLLALGCELIADDQCELYQNEARLWVRKPKSLPALIEARGVGLLPMPAASPAQVSLVVDMDMCSTTRLPEDMTAKIGGHQIKMFAKSESHHFPAAVLLYLKHCCTT